MRGLEQEAEEYSSQFGPVNHHERVPSFIAGAKSKWVETEKIKAQIEVLEFHIKHPTKPGYKRHDVLDRIKSLKVQLKQLEDETKI